MIKRVEPHLSNVIAPIEQLEDESEHRREIAWGSALAAFAAATIAFAALSIASALGIPAVAASGAVLALFAAVARKAIGSSGRRVG